MPAIVDSAGKAPATSPADLAALRLEMARQDDVIRSIASGHGALHGVAHLAADHMKTLCRTLGLRDYDAKKAAKVNRTQCCQPGVVLLAALLLTLLLLA